VRPDGPWREYRFAECESCGNVDWEHNSSKWIRLDGQAGKWFHRLGWRHDRIDDQ